MQRWAKAGVSSHLQYCARNDTLGVGTFAALHCVRLPGTSLPVAEQAHLQIPTPLIMRQPSTTSSGRCIDHCIGKFDSPIEATSWFRLAGADRSTEHRTQVHSFIFGSGESNKGYDFGSLYLQLVCRRTGIACSKILMIKYE